MVLKNTDNKDDVMFDKERYSRWRRASHGLYQIEPELVQTVQMLGRIDAELIAKDDRYRAIPESANGTAEEWQEMAEHSVPMSYLWVLGTYEVVRTLDQMLDDVEKFPVQQPSGSKQVKHAFERVRMPLAKLEPAKRYRATDNRFAVPALILGRGLGWTVADNVSVARAELSTQFLEFLEELKLSVTTPPGPTSVESRYP